MVSRLTIKIYRNGTNKKLWLKRLRTPYVKPEHSELYDDHFFEDINGAIEQEKSYLDRLQRYLLKITDHCKGLIDKMFFRNRSIGQIQKEYGYSSRHNAQNQKHKCMEQIRKVKEQDGE